MFAPARAGLTPAAFQQLTAFMAERHAVYMRKTWIEVDGGRPNAGMSARMQAAWMGMPGTEGNIGEGPERWGLAYLTDDPILQRFRFCNVYRELDAVTVWIRENIREPFADHEHLWFMLAVARHINWPDTLAELIQGSQPLYQINPLGGTGSISEEEGLIYPSWPADRFGRKDVFEPRHMTSVLQRRQARGDKVYTGAYMIRAEQHDHPWRHWPKVRYSAEIVLGRLWEAREVLQPIMDNLKSLQGIWSILQQPEFTGWGPFMAYQVVVDMRHTRYLRNAPDINEWAAVGPGSARGLNRLHGRPVKKALRQDQALAEMLELRLEMAQPGALAPWLDLPDLSDVQNCLCEFDKYERVRLGEGRPRALYVPGRGG
jgi:hypothetical protein